MSALAKAFNKQINNEFHSAYLYLSMSTYCAENGFVGFANWLRIQAQEEMTHAGRMYDYALSRDMKLEFNVIEAPQTKWKNPLDVMQTGLKHEKFITKSLNDLTDLAIKEKDHATQIFLSWYVTEQVEEEQNFTDIINALKIINCEGQGLLMLDREMATRTFVDPTANATA